MTTAMQLERELADNDVFRRRVTQPHLRDTRGITTRALLLFSAAITVIAALFLAIGAAQGESLIDVVVGRNTSSSGGAFPLARLLAVVTLILWITTAAVFLGQRRARSRRVDEAARNFPTRGYVAVQGDLGIPLPYSQRSYTRAYGLSIIGRQGDSEQALHQQGEAVRAAAARVDGSPGEAISALCTPKVTVGSRISQLPDGTQVSVLIPGRYVVVIDDHLWQVTGQEDGPVALSDARRQAMRPGAAGLEPIVLAQPIALRILISAVIVGLGVFAGFLFSKFFSGASLSAMMTVLGLIVVLLVLGILAYAIHYMWSSTLVDAQGVTIRRPLAPNRHIPWPQINGFAAHLRSSARDSGAGQSYRHFIAVVVESTRTIVLPGLLVNSHRMATPDSIVRMIDELEARRTA